MVQRRSPEGQRACNQGGAQETRALSLAERSKSPLWSMRVYLTNSHIQQMQLSQD